jgi:uncharacterized protein YkwD
VRERPCRNRTGLPISRQSRAASIEARFDGAVGGTDGAVGGTDGAVGGIDGAGDAMGTTATEPSSRWLYWLVTGLAFCLLYALLVNPATPGPVGAHRDAAALMLTWVNEERLGADLGPLESADDIAIVAEAWSAEMASMVTMEHNPSFGDQLCCWETVTENVAYGQAYRVWLPGDPIERMTRELHEGLLASPGHRANLLDPSVDQIGIGIHLDAEGTMWITQNFRRSR